eukprot:g7083.t1
MTRLLRTLHRIDLPVTEIPLKCHQSHHRSCEISFCKTPALISNFHALHRRRKPTPVTERDRDAQSAAAAAAAARQQRFESTAVGKAVYKTAKSSNKPLPSNERPDTSRDWLS